MNQFAKRVIVALALCLVVVQTVAIAQNLGAAPQVNVAVQGQTGAQPEGAFLDRKSTRLNSSHLGISYAVFCLKKKKNKTNKLTNLSDEVSAITPCCHTAQS